MIDTTEMQTILERAAQQLATLAGKERELTTTLQEAENTLAAFLDAKEQATRDLATKQSALATLENAHAQAVQMAKLALATIRETHAVQQVAVLKKQVDTTRKEITTLEKHLADEKEAKLHAQIGTLQRDLTALRAEIGQTSGAQAQATNELGNLKLQATLEQIGASSKRVDDLREQLLAAQVEQQEMLVQGIDVLQDHPEQATQLREALPVPEDAIYRVVNAARLYFEVLADVLVALSLATRPASYQRSLMILNGQIKRMLCYTNCQNCKRCAYVVVAAGALNLVRAWPPHRARISRRSWRAMVAI
jgi:chromosome segregation ATPase